MSTRLLFLILITTSPLIITSQSFGAESFLIRFGVGDSAERDWRGSVSVEGGRVISLRGWQFDQGDSIAQDQRSWKTTTKRDEYWHAPWERSLFGTKRQPKLSERGVLLRVEMDGPGTVQLETRQGPAEFEPASLGWDSPKTFAGGSMVVSRTPAPARLEASGSEDYVDALLSRAGVEWAAYQTYQNRGDRLWIRRGTEPPEPLTPNGADLFRVKLAEGLDGAIWVVWSEQRDGNFDLFSRVWKNGSWSPTKRLTTARGSDIFHDLASGPDGRLYLVWQSMRGTNGEIFLRIHDGDGWGEEIRVSNSPANDWRPSVAVSNSGRAAIVWDSYAAGNYDIFLRFLENGRLSGTITIAASPSFEARPQAVFDKSGRLWLAWEEGDAQWGKDYVNQIRDAGMGLLMRRQVRVGVLDGGRLRQPKGDLAGVLPPDYGQVFLEPRLVLDGAGSPWVFFRYRTNSPVRPQPAYRSMWRLGASSFQNGKWTPLIRFAEGFGRIDAPASVHTQAGGGIKVYWVSDGRTYPQGFPANQDLYTATVAATGASASEAALEDFRFPPENYASTHPNEAQDVDRLRAYRAKAGGKTYRIVRGDMHRHTDVSWDGNRDGSLFDAYRYALDAAAHDYLGVADHNAGADVEYQWWMIQKAVDLLSIAGKFAPLYGYERSRGYPSGHRNVMFARRGVPVFQHTAAELADNNTGVDLLYEHLRKEGGTVMSHTSATGAGTDWRDRDPEVETLMEIYQGYRTSYEHEGAPRSTSRGARPLGFVWKAWEKGIKLGLQSSSDHVSTHASQGLLYVEEVSREAILDAIRARRSYAATDNILVDFRVNGALMGAAISSSAKPKLEAKIAGTGAISKVEVIRNNEYIHTQPGGTAELEFSYVDNDPPAGENYYYIRVEQQNGELAWASPVWVTME